MELKQFIEKALNNMSDMDGGNIEFDLAVYPVDGKLVVSSAQKAQEGLSRIKFSVKLANVCDNIENTP